MIPFGGYGGLNSQAPYNSRNPYPSDQVPESSGDRDSLLERRNTNKLSIATVTGGPPPPRTRRALFASFAFLALCSVVACLIWSMKLDRVTLRSYLPIPSRLYTANQQPELFAEINKAPRAVSPRRCGMCEPRLEILEGEEYVQFEQSVDPMDGCAQLKIMCGLERNTEVIVQWYRDGQDYGVSFMDEAGQSKIERTLKCNDDGVYELDENETVEVINQVECIVSEVDHEEL